MKSIWMYRLRSTLSILGLLVLTFNIFGFLFGFVFLDLTSQQIITNRHTLLIPSRSDLPLTTKPRTINRPGSNPNQNNNTTPPQPSGHHRQTARSTTGVLPWEQWSSSKNPKSRVGLKQPNAPCVLRKGRDPGDGIWYDFSVDDTFQFYVYSAFIDDRPSIGSDPVVRIIAVSTKLEEHDDLSRMGRSLYCAFSYHHDTLNSSEKRTPMIVRFENKAGPIGFGLQLDAGVKLKEYIFTCSLGRSRNSLPAAVTILGSPDRLSAVTSCVPIEVPEKPRVKEDFAVCVQVSYGQLDPHRLIEWLELQRILGVRRVGVYDLSVESEQGLEVLRHYSREGFVELRKTDLLPVPGPLQFLLHGSPVINDCLYRNMHSFNWILVIDFDEVFVPRIHTTLREFAAHVDKTFSRSPTAGPVNFILSNQYFFLDSDPDRSESANYTIIRYRRKAPLSPHGYAMKGYVDPQGCIQMHNHYCMGVAETFKTRNHYEFVDPEIATSHHYKKCHLANAECQEMLTKTTQDDVMMKYKAALKKSVEKKIKELLP